MAFPQARRGVARPLALGLGTVAALALGAPLAPAWQAPATAAIDPEADVVLRSVAEQVAARPSAVVLVADTVDDVMDNGQKVQYAHLREMTLVRPDKLKIDVRGDVTNRTLWLDGTTLTVLDRDANVYATLPQPEGGIDAAIDLLQEQHNMSIPGADLLTTTLYDTLTQDAIAVEYVGLGLVGEEDCHHLAFVAPHVDYQLWVGTEAEPRIKKMVITYKLLEGSPQYTAQVLKAEAGTGLAPETFTAVIPPGAKKIEFAPPAP